MPRRRRYDSDSDDEDFPKRTHAMGAGQGGGCTCLARGFLVVINLAVLALALALLYLGSSGMLRVDPADAETGAERPFVFVIVIGSFLLVSSLCGVIGALCAVNRDSGLTFSCCSNRLMLFYYLTMLVECALLLYATILCFVFVDKAEEYLAEYGDALLELAANEGLTLDQLRELLQGNASSAGGVCLAAMALNLLCAHLSAKVMGYRYTTQRTVLATSVLGACLGGCLLVVAALPETQEVGSRHAGLPALLAGTGAAAVAVALLGAAAALWQRPALLACNACALIAIGTALLAATLVALVAARAPEEHTDLAGGVSPPPSLLLPLHVYLLYTHSLLPLHKLPGLRTYPGAFRRRVPRLLRQRDRGGRGRGRGRGGLRGVLRAQGGASRVEQPDAARRRGVRGGALARLERCRILLPLAARAARAALRLRWVGGIWTRPSRRPSDARGARRCGRRARGARARRAARRRRGRRPVSVRRAGRGGRGWSVGGHGCVI